MKHAAQTLRLPIKRVSIVLASADAPAGAGARANTSADLATLLRIFNLEPNAMRRKPGALELWMRELLEILNDSGERQTRLRASLYEFANAWGKSEPDIKYSTRRDGYHRIQLIAGESSRWPLGARLMLRTAPLTRGPKQPRFVILTIAFPRQKPGHCRKWLPVLNALSAWLGELPKHRAFELYRGEDLSEVSAVECARKLASVVARLEAELCPPTCSPAVPAPIQVLDVATAAVSAA